MLLTLIIRLEVRQSARSGTNRDVLSRFKNGLNMQLVSGFKLNWSTILIISYGSFSYTTCVRDFIHFSQITENHYLIISFSLIEIMLGLQTCIYMYTLYKIICLCWIRTSFINNQVYSYLGKTFRNFRNYQDFVFFF